MNPPRRYIVVPLGSAGDVHPLVWLAKLLASRGHDVVVILQRATAGIPEQAGLRTIATGSLEEQEALIRNPDLWHPARAFPLLARHLPEYAREMLPFIQREIVPGRTVLVAGGIAFAARIAAEAWRLPLVTVQLQPGVFMGVQDAPIVRARLEWLKHAPHGVRKLLYSLGHKQVDRMLAKPINLLRAEAAGLPPVRGILRDWWMSPDRVLALFPDWFAPRHADWPPQTVLTRFPLYDESEERPPQPQLESFLNAGEPPLLFTPGSANRQATRFFATAVQVCEKLNRRGLLVTPFAEQLPPILPPQVLHCDYVPFSRVFPRCAAVVHHGGVGSCAQGLAAGVPQLVMAMAHDQPDNGWRLRQLGVGDYLYARNFHPHAVSERLARLTTCPDTAAACREVKARMASQLSPDRVAELVERVNPS